MTCPPELIDRLGAFHEDAFTWGIACCGGNRDVAEDLMQECYLKVVTGQAKFGGRSSLKTWWLGVVRYTALEHMRGTQRWLRRMEDLRDWLASLSEPTSSSQDVEFGASVDVDRLAILLTQLPARQAEVLHLVFQQNLSLSDAAVVMGVSVGSARQHYDRAKRRLRQQLTSTSRAPLANHEP